MLFTKQSDSVFQAALRGREQQKDHNYAYCQIPQTSHFSKKMSQITMHECRFKIFIGTKTLYLNGVGPSKLRAVFNPPESKEWMLRSRRKSVFSKSEQKYILSSVYSHTLLKIVSVRANFFVCFKHKFCTFGLSPCQLTSCWFVRTN